MDKVCVLTSFDGEDSYIVDVFSTEEKAKQSIEELEKEDIKHYGKLLDNYYIEEYEVK